MTQRIGATALAAALAAGLLAAGALPVSAQTACQQIQFTTTRITNPITVTPLDAIAFPVQLTPQTSSIVRQILVCPPGAAPLPNFTPFPPVLTPVPGVIGAPVFISPVVVPSDTGLPVLGVPAVGSSPYVVSPPAAQSGAAAPAQAAPRPSAPAVVGTVPTDTVRDLATRSAAYDRTLVTVTGTAADVQQTTDVGGRAITAFRLEAQGASVDVVAWGHSSLQAGERLRVSGPFYVSTPFLGPSGMPWHNVIDAEILER